MTEPAYVAVDWGTSSFRLWLIDRAGKVLAERRSDEGMLAAAKAGFAGVLQSHLTAVEAPAQLPVLVCGMAGAKTGWVEAGYVDTPAPLSAVLKQAALVPGETRDIRILPGIAQRDTRAPDVMRGEETQLLGAVAADAPRTLVVLPGTHSKWARVEHGMVLDFTTFMTGEMYDALLGHTILGRLPAGAPAVDGTAAFSRGVLRGLGAGGFTHDVFGARTLMLMGELPAGDVPEWLSGFVIGREIRNARTWAQHAGDDASRVLVVGSDALAKRYLTALEVSEIAATPGPVDAAAAGLFRIALAAGKLRHHA